MPNKSSAEKQARVSEKKRLRNKSARSQIKTSITKAEKVIFAGELEPAKAAVIAAISSLDKAAEKGILKPNNSARRKARLMKKLNQALVPPPVESEPEPTG